MADGRHGAAGTGLIGPLVLLTGGAITGAVFWWLLSLDPVPPREQLSGHDRASLDSLIDQPRSQP